MYQKIFRLFAILLILFAISFAFILANTFWYHSQRESTAILIAPTPPMGWNGWNHFRCSPELNEQAFKEIVDALEASGMRDAGYMYVNLDDCWQIARSSEGTIIVDPQRFPSGIAALAKYVHSKGLKFGIYTSAGRLTCERRPGSYGFEYQDVQTYASWGVDYIKVDWCGIEYLDTYTQYMKWRDAIAATGRPMVLSIAIANIDFIENNEVWLWGRDAGQLWRTAIDIQDDWNDMLRVMDRNSQYAQYAGPSGWNDADMLQIGNGGMTTEEYRTHFTMWAMMASPLIAGNDVRNMPEDIREILTQPEVIAINQDRLGNQARLIMSKNGIQMWSKKLSGFGKHYAIALLNRTEEEKDADIVWQELGLPRLVFVRNIWEKKNRGLSWKDYSIAVPPHGVVLLIVKGL